MEGSEQYGNPAYRIHLDLQRLMMKALTNGGEMGPDPPLDVTDGYERFERVSPLGQVADEIYRCPVSTPTVARRSGAKHNVPHQQFLTFNAMNHSLQIPDHISTAKHASYKIANSKSKRAAVKAQKKNFDCYFVNRVEKPAHVNAQMKSTWLNALVSQPVDEIFGKYKRRTESSKRYMPTRAMNSTPGEKALQNGWSSNASSRGSPSSMSRSTRSGPTSQQPRYSRASSSIDQNLRVYGFDQDPDRMLEHNGFALMPVSTPTFFDEEEEGSASQTSSQVFHRVFRHNPSNVHYNNMGHSNISSNASVDSGMYEAYQRDKRFPEIRPRRSTFSPTRKVIPMETREERPLSETTSSLTTLELQESPMHIVSIGNLNNENIANFDQYDNVTITKLPVSKKIPYRLPKNSMSMSLPELHVSDS